MHRILRCKYLQGGHLYDQLPRDPQTTQSGTQQNRDRIELPVRSEYCGNSTATCSELRPAMAATGVNVGQAALRAPIPGYVLETRLQDAGLRLCPQGAPAQRCHSEPAVAGILRPVQSSRRSSLPIHPIQQVLRRLPGKSQCHHAPES